MYRLKGACYLMTSVAGICLFYLSLFHGSTWSNPFCQGYCVCFTTLIANIHYNKRSVVDSRKLEGCCVYLRKTIVTLVPKGAYLFHRTSCNNFCLHPFHSFMMNVLIWQIHNSNCSYSLSIVNFFRKAIVDICSCKSGFRNSYFLQRVALSVSLG